MLKNYPIVIGYESDTDPVKAIQSEDGISLGCAPWNAIHTQNDNGA